MTAKPKLTPLQKSILRVLALAASTTTKSLTLRQIHNHLKPLGWTILQPANTQRALNHLHTLRLIRHGVYQNAYTWQLNHHSPSVPSV